MVAAVGTILTAATTLAAAQAVHPRESANESASISPQVEGPSCDTKIVTATNNLTPPDDSTSNNPPAGSVTIKKTCTGPVLGSLTTEINTSAAGGFIHLSMRATCLSAAAQPDPCTPGQQISAQPGHTFMQNVQEGTQTHAMTMVWKNLKRGRWRFEALPGGDGTAFLGFRTFVVVSY